MSGRLVILRHKSWHVWNQDNQEKVSKDKRIHAENEAKKKKEEEKIISERNLEILEQKVNNVASYNESKSAENGSVKPFRLFEDYEKDFSGVEKILNVEYEKEKKNREYKQKQKDGVADWALGDGSLEKSKKRAWYEAVGVKSEFQSINDDELKARNDPMNQILHKDSSFENAISKLKEKSTGQDDPPHVAVNTNNSIESLRRKRLEREKQERKRESILLAQHDIFGNSDGCKSINESNFSRKYNRQFNPKIAR